MRHFWCTVLIAAALSMPAAEAAIINLNKNIDDSAITDIYEKVNPGIVVVDAELKDGTSSGTGCIIDPDGIILTSSHVISNASDIQITISSGEVYKGETLSVLGKDNDLALIKISPKRPLPALKLGDSEKVKVGQRVLAIGNPFGFNGTLTTGIVSRIDYSRNKIQTDAAINPGNSGGPIVNIKGEVIGISQSIYNPDNNISNIGIGFAVPINEAKSFIKLTLADIGAQKSSQCFWGSKCFLRVTQKNHCIFNAIELPLIPVHIIVSFFHGHKVKIGTGGRQKSCKLTEFPFDSKWIKHTVCF